MTARLLGCIATLALVLLLGPAPVEAETTEGRLEVRMKPVPNGVRKVYLVNQEGGVRYELLMRGGTTEVVTPQQLAERLERDQHGRKALYRFLNITSWTGIAWVAMGFLAQGVFAGRMIVQWLASERAGRSVVPAAFWWMSLAGASMLITYFIWRRDIVGVLGQSTGWTIYLRNLWFIYRPRLAESSAP